MADCSLDDYIKQKGIGLNFKRWESTTQARIHKTRCQSIQTECVGLLQILSRMCKRGPKLTVVRPFQLLSA